MKECTCDLRTRTVGDGCEICNPEKALEYTKESLAEAEAERDAARRELDALKAGFVAARELAANPIDPHTDSYWIGFLMALRKIEHHARQLLAANAKYRPHSERNP